MVESERKMINFNVPPFTGKEFDYMKEAVENQKICGDGPFTKRCSEWIEKKTGTAKCLLTTSCTHATELAALLADIGRRRSDFAVLYFCVHSGRFCATRGESGFCGCKAGYHEY